MFYRYTVCLYYHSVKLSVNYRAMFDLKLGLCLPRKYYVPGYIFKERISSVLMMKSTENRQMICLMNILSIGYFSLQIYIANVLLELSVVVLKYQYVVRLIWCHMCTIYLAFQSTAFYLVRVCVAESFVFYVVSSILFSAYF